MCLENPIEFATQSYHRHDFPYKGNISHRIGAIIQEEIGAKKAKNGTQYIQFILLDKSFIEPGEKEERTMNTERQKNKM